MRNQAETLKHTKVDDANVVWQWLVKFLSHKQHLFSKRTHTHADGKKKTFIFFTWGTLVLLCSGTPCLMIYRLRCHGVIDRWPGIHSCQSQARAFLFLSPPTCLILSVWYVWEQILFYLLYVHTDVKRGWTGLDCYASQYHRYEILPLGPSHLFVQHM